MKRRGVIQPDARLEAMPGAAEVELQALYATGSARGLAIRG
ncbi:MAG TPA: hypothetical protein VHJ18_23000 [Streptosporangiaceae bacterium]|jgi:hypothetical protein|nr:hypothetical protein [Streptosporangiaceae bacterium]